jgi:AcrR family transcriptional regulator
MPPTDNTLHTRERIIAAALELIDREGLDSFSTRKLADQVGLKVMSLYHYFPSRDALLDQVVDNMIGEMPLPDVTQIEWREGLLQLAKDYRAMGHRHLRAIPLLAQRCPAAPAMQAFLDTLSCLLLKAGLKPVGAVDWLLIQRDYVIGSLLADHSAWMLADKQSSSVQSAQSNQDAKNYFPDRDERQRIFEKGFVAMLGSIGSECGV